jgi:hypothetical protein
MGGPLSPELELVLEPTNVPTLVEEVPAAPAPVVELNVPDPFPVPVTAATPPLPPLPERVPLPPVPLFPPQEATATTMATTYAIKAQK